MNLEVVKICNLKVMDKFLETYNLPRLNREEIKKSEQTITIKDIESITKNCPRKKS